MFMFDELGSVLENSFIFRVRTIFWRFSTAKKGSRIIMYFLFSFAFLLIGAIPISLFVGDVFYSSLFGLHSSVADKIRDALGCSAIGALCMTISRYKCFIMPPSLGALRKDFVKGNVTENNFVCFYPNVKKQILGLKDEKGLKVQNRQDEGSLKKEKIMEVVAKLKAKRKS